jgi:hypothetical protein
MTIVLARPKREIRSYAQVVPRAKLPDMQEPARVMVHHLTAIGPRAALFGPFGDCVYVLLHEGGYLGAACWVETNDSRYFDAELREAWMAGAITRATGCRTAGEMPQRCRDA